MTRAKLDKMIRKAQARPGIKELCTVSAAALLLTGCGSIWTIGFFGATLSVEFPREATLTASASVTTAPLRVEIINPPWPATQETRP